MLPFQSI